MQNKKLPQTISWKAESHKQHQRSSVWYLGFGLVSLGLIIFAIVSHSIITLITFVLMIAIVLVMSMQSPKLTAYHLTSTGISAGTVSYPYKIIKSFWITYDPPHVKTLNFETTAYLNNKVSVELGNQDPVAVKLFLSQYLIEDLDREESLSESLARRLKL